MKRRIVRGLVRRDRPMPCDQVARWLQHYLDGELDARRSERLVAHLDDCRRCGLEAATYESIKQALMQRQSVTGHDETIARLRNFAERLARGDPPT
jgi:anti-sigma factor RsiW